MGAVAGAMAGGVMMSMGLAFGAVFMLLAVPAVVAALALFALGRRDAPARWQKRGFCRRSNASGVSTARSD
ncbi:hypothetical protein [Caballeronia sp. HLA56]